MVIFLPLVLVLLVFGLLAGETNIVFLVPMLLTLAVGAVFVNIAMRDGRRKRDPSVPTLPADHLRRQVYMALRPHRSRQRRRRDAKSE
jgi:hypothetical protein